MLLAFTLFHGWSLQSGSAQQVRLNELVAAVNERSLAADEQGRMRPGTGPFWVDAGFSAPGWLTGTAPFGYAGPAGLGTNLLAKMRNRTPNLYLRRTVTLSAQDVANEGQLTLTVRFDDGFIAWINGREVARANTGPAGHFIYHDQKAYNFATGVSDAAYTPAAQPGTATSQPVAFTLGKVSDFLKTGDNVLAVQLVNREPGTSARIDAQLAVVTASAVVDLARWDFNDANDAAAVYRNAGGQETTTVEGAAPPGSWLAASPPPMSGPGWADLTVRTSLPAGQGIAASGALRMAHSQNGTSQPATVFGPGIRLNPQIAPGALTEADLANLRLSFKFRASPEAGFNLRLDPSPALAAAASSLTGFPVINATAGTAAAENAAVDFAGSEGSYRTRMVNDAGVATLSTSGTPKTSAALLSGGGMKGAEFRLTEDNTAGGGGQGSTGALVFEVITAPAVPDFFGFYYQTIPIRSWTAGKVTAEQLRAGAMEFDWQLPAGVSYEVYMEPSTGTPNYGDRLVLGTITGTGGWRRAVLETGAAENQAAFLTYVNTLTSNSMRLVFRSSSSLPAGTKLRVDNIRYHPWRTWTAQLSTGTNAAAFVAALNARASLEFYPALEITGAATAPASAVTDFDDFALTLTKPNAGSAVTLVPLAAPGWSYIPGLAEPSGGLVETADFTPATGTGEFSDWIELLNPAATEADISGWGLTDNAADGVKFTFPAGTKIAPGGTMVVLADSRSAPAGAVWPHAPFSLSADGETVTLTNAAGAVMDSILYPAQDAFHSFGRDPATSAWGFLRTASPGQPNSGKWEAARAADPVFSLPGGFYTGPVSLSVTSATPGAVIRYTTNGTEPGLTNGILYSGPFTLPFLTDRTGHPVKARAFVPGLMESAVVTQTYLINQHANLKKNGAVLLSGDPGSVFYKPLGIMAIQGSTYADSLWRAAARTDYNIPVGDGRLTDPDSSSRPYERPAFLEYYFSDGREGIRENAGIRVSSSPYSRPRLMLTTAAGTVFPADPTQKPSFNVFFRSDYGNDAISYPLIPETDVRHFEEFRLRAGKNDISNPFIRDEFVRRLWTDMGHEGTVGTFVSVYLNGYYKGFYNLVERIREPFMQSHYHSSAKWDVNYINVFEDGDITHWNTVLQPRLNANLTVKTNWDSLRQVLDVENVADYFLLNIWAAMWDWPGNNWAMARERSATGLWRCYVWDAEGGLNMGGHGANWPTLKDDLLAAGATAPLPAMFKRLMTSPEFRLLFADRVQRHLFNSGVLTDARTAARRTATAAEAAPLLLLSGVSADVSWYTSWTNASAGRRRYLFPFGTVGAAGYQAGQLRDPNQDNNLSDTLWPLTLPPVFSQHGGPVAAGFALGITSTAPAGSVIYCTTDGSDPRQWGGTVSPNARIYSDPVPLSGAAVTVSSRVRHATTNEWSPMTQAVFQVAVVPATAADIVIPEIMYHPPDPTTAEAAAGFTDPEEFEYLVLRNIGASPVSLGGLRFTEGITFDFAASRRQALDPGQQVVLAKNAAALRLRYGSSGIDAVLGGEFFGNLSNSGEFLRLERTADASVIKAFAYQDKAPWPKAADGGGPSLMLVNPGANPDHSLAVSWTASPSMGGQPGGSPLALTYAQWSAWTFTAADLADPARTAAAGDFDGDGWPNLLEFLLGTSPKEAAALPVLSWSVLPGENGTRILSMTIPQVPAASGYRLEIQSSADLQTWETGHTLKQTVTAQDGRAMQTWEKAVPSTAGARHYMRLRAISLP